MDTWIVSAIVAAALAYVGFRVVKRLRPGEKGPRCGCSTSGSGCGGCPIAKNSKPL